MRFYLSSYRMGDRWPELLAMAGGAGARVAVVTNALDAIPAADRLAYEQTGGFSAAAWFRGHGMEAEDLDLRPFFGRPEALDAALADIDLVWAVGGNTFLLLRALRQSGLDRIIERRLADDTLAYGGWSAGACAAGSTLHGLETMDDPDVVPEGYEAEPPWEGLGLVSYAIIPHFQSNHPEADGAIRAAAAMATAGTPFRPLRDGDAIVLISHG